MDALQASLSVHLYVVSMMELGFQSFAWRFPHRFDPNTASRTRPPTCYRIGIAHLSGEQDMQPLQIERQTDQAPFASDSLLTAQRELPEPDHLFDDADDGFAPPTGGASL